MWKKFTQRFLVIVSSCWLLGAGCLSAVHAYGLGEFAPYSSAPADANHAGQSIVQIVIVVAALLTLGYLIWGAIDLIKAGSDKSKLEAARNKMLYAVIGILILTSTWAVYELVIKVTLGSNLSDVKLEKLNN